MQNIFSGVEKKSGISIYWDGEELKIVPYYGIKKVYHCGKELKIAPPPPKSMYLLIVMDKSEATIGLLHGKRIIKIWSDKSGIAGKHNQGGQSSQRFERQRDEQVKQWYKKVGDKLNKYGHAVRRNG